jgi:hypothetical protein
VGQNTLIRVFVMVCVLTVAGCKNSSAPPESASTGSSATNSAATPDSNSGPAQGSGVQKSQDSTLAHPFTPKPVVVREGTKLEVTADQAISSKNSNPGDSFDASIAEPVVVGEKVVIPKGSKVTGTVTEAKSAGRFKGNAAIGVTLSSVTVHGEEYKLKTTEVTETGKGRGKRTAVGAGGGAVAGALIGALAGRGKGAAIGAAAGAGAGTAGAAVTGDKDIVIAPETRLTFELQEPLEVQKK